MAQPARSPVTAVMLVALGLALAAMGVYVANADDAPGAAGIGMLLMAAGVWLGVRAWRGRLSVWIARTALVVGFIAAAFAASITHYVVTTRPLFGAPEEVPSVTNSAPPPDYARAIEQARVLVRAAIAQQNLPGGSVAVGADGTVVWAEGFGWRDVGTQTPVTPDTRFNIGTAAPFIVPGVTSLGLENTGTDAVRVWSPEDIGGEGEDFPPFTFARHIVLQPLGLMPADYPLPGDRATFYVPRFGDDPRHGRRLMYARDLACCAADGMVFYSTPSDLVRAAAATDAGRINGVLAGGLVMSLAFSRVGIVVAVTSNMAHANTSELAVRIGKAFAAGQ